MKDDILLEGSVLRNLRSHVLPPTANANPGEIKRFLVSGGSAVACDSIVYALLFSFVPPSIAKVISYVSGTVVAFLLNKFWTFKKPRRSPVEVVKFICLYASTLSANVFVNRFILDHAASIVPAIQPYLAQFAFMGATGTSTILNYLGQKFWVFKTNHNLDKSAQEAEHE